MVTIQIPEELDAVLKDAANRAGRTPEEYLEELILTHLQDESLPLSAFSELELARFKESAAQLDRGESVSAEEVDGKFAALFERLAAR